jgi:hypothetical protein
VSVVGSQTHVGSLSCIVVSRLRDQLEDQAPVVGSRILPDAGMPPPSTEESHRYDCNHSNDHGRCHWPLSHGIDSCWVSCAGLGYPDPSLGRAGVARGGRLPARGSRAAAQSLVSQRRGSVKDGCMEV